MAEATGVATACIVVKEEKSEYSVVSHQVMNDKSRWRAARPGNPTGVMSIFRRRAASGFPRDMMVDKCKVRPVNVSPLPGTTSAPCGVYFSPRIRQLSEPRRHV